MEEGEEGEEEEEDEVTGTELTVCGCVVQRMKAPLWWCSDTAVDPEGDTLVPCDWD